MGILSIFMAIILRRRIVFEIGARDFLAFLRRPNLEGINGFCGSPNKDVRFASILMLSSTTSKSSVRQFMQYISNAHDVDAILLQCLH